MNSGKPGVPAAVSAKSSPGPLNQYFRTVLTMIELETRKLKHDPTELITRAIQPLLWLLIFGQAFSKVRAIPTGDVPYLAFMTPGILSQSVMFIAIFYGISIIWEKDMGHLQKLLAMPVPRTALVLGKAMSASVRSVSQTLIIFLVAAALRIPLRWGIGNLAAVVLVTILGSMCFASFSMAIASLVKSRERFMGIGQVMTMPLFFASNALYPLAMMPDWLRIVARFNPLSYMVDLLRGLLVTGQTGAWITDIGVLAAACAILVIVAARFYPKIIW